MKRPETPTDFAAFRCKASCKIGRDAIEGKTTIPENTTCLEYAVYNLLHAIEELSCQIESIGEKNDLPKLQNKP